MLQDAGLRGRGGAGFPTFKKWSFVRAEPAPRYMVINADEGEPGTFKDRHYLEQAPHRFLEGALVSAWAVDAAALYIYLRDEYPGLHAVLREAIMEAEAAGLALAGSAVASDAFFPFRDGLDVVIDHGASCVIQPGGSMRDQEVIDAADERGVAMVFTGVRHFRH